jgi:hypothetical protein
MWETRNAHKILVDESEGNRPLGEIGVYERVIEYLEVECVNVDWIHLAEIRIKCVGFVNMAMDLPVL